MQVAELADAPVSDTGFERSVSSNLTLHIISSSGGMEDTLVLRTSAIRRESSSLSGSIRPIRLKVRTAVFQAADVEFKSRMGHCGYSIKVSTSDCGSENSGSIPDSHPMGRSHSGNCSGL